MTPVWAGARDGRWEATSKEECMASSTERTVGEERRGTELNRVISRPMLIFFIIGDILGAGIYALTGQVAGDVGGAIWASFLVSFVLAFMTAFAYMELVTKYPLASGAALYVHKAFRRNFVTFLVAFAVMGSGVTSASFAATRIGGSYFTGLTGVENPPTLIIAIVVMLLVAALNYRGIAESIKVNIGITFIEATGLLFIIGIGAFVLLSGDGNPGQAFTFKESGFGAFTGILAGAATAFYAFIGFEDAVNLAEEVKEPHRSFPPALVTGIVGATIIYLLVAFTAAMTVPLNVLTESTGPLLEVVERGVPGLNAGRFFSAIAMIAVSNTMLINMVMASRLLYGMGRQRVLPSAFSRVSPTRRTPVFSILFTTGLALLLIIAVDRFSDSLTELSDATVLLLLVGFTLVNIATLVLRRDPVDHDHFVAPTIMPVLGAIISFIFLLPVVGREGSVYVVAGFVLLLGVVLWAVNFAVRRSTGEIEKLEV
jgi:APA family basic amino acid/polyamine antiporter